MTKLVEYSEAVWIGGTLLFMVLTTTIGAVQLYRHKGFPFDMPEFFDMPKALANVVFAVLLCLSMVIAVAAFATMMLAVLVPVVRWLMH
jgi:hypothetical protein